MRKVQHFVKLFCKKSYVKIKKFFVDCFTSIFVFLKSVEDISQVPLQAYSLDILVVFRPHVPATMFDRRNPFVIGSIIYVLVPDRLRVCVHSATPRI